MVKFIREVSGLRQGEALKPKSINILERRQGAITELHSQKTRSVILIQPVPGFTALPSQSDIFSFQCFINFIGKCFISLPGQLSICSPAGNRKEMNCLLSLSPSLRIRNSKSDF